MILFRWRFDRSSLRSRWSCFFRRPGIGITERGHWGFERSLDERTHFSMAPCPWLARNSANMARTSAVNSICGCLFLPLLEEVSLRGLDNFATTSVILRKKSTRWWSIPKDKKKKISHRIHIWFIVWLLGYVNFLFVIVVVHDEGQGGWNFLGYKSLASRGHVDSYFSLSVESRFLYSARTQIRFLFRKIISH